MDHTVDSDRRKQKPAAFAALQPVIRAQIAFADLPGVRHVWCAQNESPEMVAANLAASVTHRSAI